MRNFKDFLLNKNDVSKFGGIFASIIIFFGFILVFLSLKTLAFSLNNDQKVITSSYCLNEIAERSISVYISGAVEKPGVFVVPPESRVELLVGLAGGFSADANTSFIAKELNLARMLNDGEKIYVPSSDGSISQEIKTLDQSSISINFSDREMLMTLVGVGEKRANDIIAGRPYLSIEQFLAKNVIPSSVYEDNKNKLSL